MKNLRDLFLEQLRDMYYAEERMITTLPKLANAATCSQLRRVIQSHLAESEGHMMRLEQIFEAFDEVAKGLTCDATVGLVKEAEKTASNFEASSAGNAAIICALQKIEHYEIASYGCLRDWAVTLGQHNSAALLQEILNQEKEANAVLTKLARSKSNNDAMSDSERELVRR